MSDPITEMVEQVFKAVSGFVQKNIAALDVKLTALGKRIDELPEPIHGKDGAPGPQGEKGLDGKDGTDGIDGRDGRDGVDGKDALQLEILDGIDTNKRYQRGTYASYKGGLIRAFRATDPLTDAGLEKAGWSVVIKGIAEVTVDATNDLRTFGIAVRYTDDSTLMKTFAIPVVLDKGVWKQGKYQHGDSVTWDGIWIAQEDTEDKPGTSKAWRLALRRGRDGKNGVDGKDGAPGMNGKDGRDARYD